MTARRLLPIGVAAAALAVIVIVLVAQAGGSRSATGLVVDVDAAGLTDVRGFTLRTDDGSETTFRLGALENAGEFPPSHLAEHLATGQRVVVRYREAADERVAHRIEDAPGG